MAKGVRLGRTPLAFPPSARNPEPPPGVALSPTQDPCEAPLRVLTLGRHTGPGEGCTASGRNSQGFLRARAGGTGRPSRPAPRLRRAPTTRVGDLASTATAWPAASARSRNPRRSTQPSPGRPRPRSAASGSGVTRNALPPAGRVGRGAGGREPGRCLVRGRPPSGAGSPPASHAAESAQPLTAPPGGLQHGQAGPAEPLPATPATAGWEQGSQAGPPVGADGTSRPLK